MAKWADYCISEVRYDGLRKHIVRVRVRLHDDGNNTIGPYAEWSRSAVVASVEDVEHPKIFVTITEKGNEWYKGKDVHIIKVNGVKYIRTDANSKEFDDLENLPEF